MVSLVTTPSVYGGHSLCVYITKVWVLNGKSSNCYKTVKVHRNITRKDCVCSSGYYAGLPGYTTLCTCYV